MRRHLIAAAVLIVAAPAFARANFVATYSFTGLAGDEASVAPESQPAGVTLSDITRGSGLNPFAGDNSINSDHWTTATTPDPDDYYQFTVTPSTPTDLTSLAFTARRSPIDGPTGVEVAYSLNNFAASTVVALFALAPDSDANFREMIGLAGNADLQGLTTTATFRIYAFGAGGADGTFRLGIDKDSAGSDLPANLVLTSGIQSVPEPAGVVLLGIGLVGMVIAGRVRKVA